jgi:hypothetical protein
MTPASFSFGTKAETLQALAPLVTRAVVPELLWFPVEEWRRSRNAVIERVRAKFGSALLAVRSSALSEDGAHSSNAGAYASLLHVRADTQSLADAVEEVVGSMSGNPRDQVLVQAMVSDVAVGGVIMTYDLVHGAPYYCIDFDDESGRTDGVTSGTGVHKSLFVYRDAPDGTVRSARVASFVELARELEALCDCAALDIEFGMTRAGELVLFQVRRIVLARNWHPVTERRVKRQVAHVAEFIAAYSQRREGMLGSRTILAIMPDWNPAEIIGTTPRPLAASLYSDLITNSVWCRARAALGYRPLGDTELMVVINNHPYIDVRASFNSFLPAGIADGTGEKLLDAWLDRLQAYPEFHDKVEFEIVPTCVDFCFREDFGQRYPGLLTDDEFSAYRLALTTLTRSCLGAGPGSSLQRALDRAAGLESLQPAAATGEPDYSLLDRASYLLGRCREDGTFSFAVAARHAFIAEALLRSAVRRGALSAARLQEFKRGIRTVTGRLLEEYALVCGGKLPKQEFYRRYGHLRPGTYEITSLRYDERDDLFTGAMPMASAPAAEPFALSRPESAALQALLKESGLDVLTPDELMAYAAKAIAAREDVKFTFTRVLSDALSLLHQWGEAHGLSRDDVSFIEWPQLSRMLHKPVMDEVDSHFLDIAEAARRSMAAAHAFRIGHLVFGVGDLYAATLNRSVPNFVGLGSASAEVVVLEANTPTTVNLKGKVVCIANADPGFDWIFTKAPGALVTCFGGANSHMAVRCAEFGLPAAIGCGDQLYERLVRSSMVEVNCAARIVRPMHG